LITRHDRSKHSDRTREPRWPLPANGVPVPEEVHGLLAGSLIRHGRFTDLLNCLCSPDRFQRVYEAFSCLPVVLRLSLARPGDVEHRYLDLIDPVSNLSSGALEVAEGVLWRDAELSQWLMLGISGSPRVVYSITVSVGADDQCRIRIADILNGP